MELYHGSYMAIPSPEIVRGKFTKDFGEGFYCTELKRQAVKWAKRYDTPIVDMYDYHRNDALKILQFDGMTDEWLDYDQIYNYVADFMNGVLTREQFWVLAKFKYPTHQISFCTSDALKCITYKGHEEVKE